MRKLLLALLMLPLASTIATAQTAGDAADGKMLWESAQSQCGNCHGMKGEGAFGPDLAGRGLSAAEFRQAARKPWGIMPAYLESQYSDADLNNFAAYFASLPKQDQPGKWRYEVTSTMPQGQQLLLGLGCGQCHQPGFVVPRIDMGALNADFATFKGLVYNHTDTLADFKKASGDVVPPRLRMGNFSNVRFAESQLQIIYDWVKNDIGFRAPLQGKLSAAKADAKGATYALDLTNAGIKGKGLAAEGITVSLILPAGANVVATTGDGYKGVHMDADAKANVASWEVAQLSATESRAFSITLSQAATKDANLRGNVKWTKAGTRPTPDMINIAPAPLQ